MKSIIEKIYYGELSPCSLPTSNTEKYIKAREDIETIREKLEKKYPDWKKHIECLVDAIHITASFWGLQYFTTGITKYLTEPQNTCGCTSETVCSRYCKVFFVAGFKRLF